MFPYVPISIPYNSQFVLNQNSKQKQGLRAWYPANWSANSKSIYNLGYARDGNGTLSSANSWSKNVPGMGYLLEFDGSTSAGINVGANATHRFTDYISVFAWIYPRSIPTTNNSHIIISISDSIGAGGWEFAHRNILGGSTSVCAFAYYDGSVRGWYTGTGTFSANTLYHVGFTYKPGTLNFYINGVLDSSPSITSGTIVYVSDSTRLGDQTSNLEFNGGIADLRLYNKYLTATEVLDLYRPRTRWELYSPLNRFYTLGSPAIAQTVTLTAADATALGYSVVTNQYQAIDKSDATALGYNLVTNQIQAINKSDALAIGNNSTANQVQVVNKSDALAVGNNLSTNQIQPINKSDALALGYDISITSNTTSVVNLADSVAVGYSLTNKYIIGLTSADALANSTLLNTYYLQSIGQALATAIGNNLSTNYIQPVNSGLAVALGYSVSTQLGAVTKVINLANAIALGYHVNTSDFQIILSPERIYKPDFYNRTHIPSDDRIYRIKNYGKIN